MKSKIIVSDMSLDFRTYHNRTGSLKESVIGLFKKKKHNLDDKKTFKALKNINLEINHGDRLGIVGHNGAGKSTLLKTLCRIYEPTTGSVKIEGRIAPLLEIGAGFNPELSGIENIYLNAAILGYNVKEIKKIERDIIEFSGLEEFIEMPVKYYSTGMYMKLAFSIATAVKPDILILDELFAGGDADFIEKAQSRMKSFINDSSIMVFVSHQTELLEDLCNRVIWIDHGTLKADGEPKEIINRYLNTHKNKI